jgi:hypothetical protein
LIAFSIVAVQCPQLISGTSNLVMGVSFASPDRWGVPVQEGQELNVMAKRIHLTY